MRRAALLRWAFLLMAAGLMVLTSAPASAETLPSGFRDEEVLRGLEEPTAVRFAPDGRVFVAEKTGIILVYDSLADPTPTVFDDLRTEAYDSGDRGLLGLALDPDFPARPYVYALYTYDHLLGEAAPAPKWGQPDHTGDACPKPEGTGVDQCPVSGRLVRLTAEGDHAAPEKKVLVEDWCQQYSSHSIGDLQFGPEGDLFASAGDGSNANAVDYGQAGWPERNMCGDPPAGRGGVEAPPAAEGGALRAQDVRTPADPTGLSGTVIRIDPETGQGVPGNPFFGSADANARRIVGFGFRNPFRFALDPADGDVYVGNVGWNTYEEIDQFPAAPARAFNSGWPCYEGPEPNPDYAGLGLALCESLYAEPDAVGEPFFYYRHDDNVVPGDGCSPQPGSAIDGLAVYPGGGFPPAYEGALFFADSVRGCIYVMYPGPDGSPDRTSTALFLSGGPAYPGIDIEPGPEGDLYYVSLYGEGLEGEEFGPGAVHRISFDTDAPVARLEADRRWGPASFAHPLEVQLDAGLSTDSHGARLEYEWDLDGDGTFEVAKSSSPLLTAKFTGNENVEVAVRVSNGSTSSVAHLTVYPGDTPPTPVISEPTEALTWRVGQAIDFAGFAGDAEDGYLGDADLYWKARLYHCPLACHVHPLQSFGGVRSGTLIAPDHDYPSRIELTLTAVDSRGLAASRSVQLLPVEVDQRISSEPPGLTLSAGLATGPAPFTLPAIEGGEVVLSAPPTQSLDGVTYTWTAWSDGGDRVHSVSAVPNAAYTAIYAPTSPPPLASSPSPFPFPQPSPLPLPPPSSPPATTGGALEGVPELHSIAAPRSRIVKRPARRSSSATAGFVFEADQPDVRFRCKLDSGPYRPCDSLRTYRHLRVGPHRLRVLATNRAGVVQETPTVFGWRVVSRG